MRQTHERLLAAKGISLGRSIPIKALRVVQAKDHTSRPLLLVRGRIYGPSWPSVADYLEQSGIECWLIEAGMPWLVIADSSATREALQDLARASNQSASERILVPDVGFVSAGKTKRFDSRTLIGPAVLALISLGLALVPAALPSPTEQSKLELPKITCALDLEAVEFRNWIVSNIESSPLSGSGNVLVESDLGLLTLQTGQIIGSTQSLTGSIECKDGRLKSLHYRLDTSADGSLVELSQKLDP